jgi:hypothetical protein
MEDHITANSDAEFEVELHPAFASRVTVKSTGGEERDLYKQNGTHHLKGTKHPKKHRIKLKDKNGKRDLTITVDDPRYAIARITVELYPEEHDPMNPDHSDMDSVMTLSVHNAPDTCPPVC